MKTRNTESVDVWEGKKKRKIAPKKGKKEEEKKEEEKKEEENDEFDEKDLEFNGELKEWDPKSLPDNFFVVLEGKRRTGKSTFAKWLLQWYQNEFALVWCMTKTSVSGYWQEFVGDKFTFDDWYPSAVYRLIQRNDQIVKKFGEDSPHAKKLCATLIILDDVISGKVHDDPTFKLLAVEGRHHLISIILATQDPKAISPLVRDNADLAVVFNQKTWRNKESIWHDFMNDVDKKTSQALLQKYAVDHDALVCIQTNLNGEIRKNFMITTGDKTKLWDPHYTLGSDEQKRLTLEYRKTDKEKKKRARAQPVTPIPSSEVKMLEAEKFLSKFN